MSLSKSAFYMMSEFGIVVQIAKILTVKVKTEIQTVVYGVLTTADTLLGALFGGTKGLLSGALAGATAAGILSETKKVNDLAEYLLNCLPKSLRSALVSFFQVLLVPFKAVDMAADEFLKLAIRLKNHFLSLMATFFEQHNIKAVLMT